MSALSDGDRLPYELGLLIALSRRALWTAAARDLEANGFSMLVWVLLAHLARTGPSTQRKIAEATGQHPAGVSRMLVELEEQKLVRRHRDPSDLRRSRVELTPAGRKSFVAARPHVIGALREVLAPLSLDQKKALRALLLVLCPGVEVESERAPSRKRKPSERPAPRPRAG